jgi:hypothetical protein
MEMAAVKLPSLSFCNSSAEKVIASGDEATGPLGWPTTAWPRGESGIGSINAVASGGMLSGHLYVSALTDVPSSTDINRHKLKPDSLCNFFFTFSFIINSPEDIIVSTTAEGRIDLLPINLSASFFLSAQSIF